MRKISFRKCVEKVVWLFLLTHLPCFWIIIDDLGIKVEHLTLVFDVFAPKAIAENILRIMTLSSVSWPMS